VRTEPRRECAAFKEVALCDSAQGTAGLPASIGEAFRGGFELQFAHFPRESSNANRRGPLPGCQALATKCRLLLRRLINRQEALFRNVHRIDQRASTRPPEGPALGNEQPATACARAGCWSSAGSVGGASGPLREVRLCGLACRGRRGQCRSQAATRVPKRYARRETLRADVARCSTLVYLRRSCDRALARQCDEYSHSDPKPAAGNRASALSGGERGDLVGATERGRIPGSSRRPGMSVTRHSFCCRPTFHSIGQLAERRGSVALRFGNPHEQWVGLPIQACPKGRTRLRSTNGSDQRQRSGRSDDERSMRRQSTASTARSRRHWDHRFHMRSASR
jgi:hypothetical protein